MCALQYEEMCLLHVFLKKKCQELPKELYEICLAPSCTGMHYRLIP